MLDMHINYLLDLCKKLLLTVGAMHSQILHSVGANSQN